jgi:hypothetical protein
VGGHERGRESGVQGRATRESDEGEGATRESDEGEGATRGKGAASARQRGRCVERLKECDWKREVGRERLQERDCKRERVRGGGERPRARVVKRGGNG